MGKFFWLKVVCCAVVGLVGNSSDLAHAQTKAKKNVDRTWKLAYTEGLPVRGEPVLFGTKADHVVHIFRPVDGWECTFLPAMELGGKSSRAILCVNGSVFSMVSIECPTAPGSTMATFSIGTIGIDGLLEKSVSIAGACEVQ